MIPSASTADKGLIVYGQPKSNTIVTTPYINELHRPVKLDPDIGVRHPKIKWNNFEWNVIQDTTINESNARQHTNYEFSWT